MLQVAFDEQAFTFQRQGGISRYFGALISHLSRNIDLGVDPRLAFWIGQNAHANVAQMPEILPKRLSTSLAFVANTPRRFRRTEIVHNTFYHPRFLKHPRGRLRVATLHDMIPEQYPGLFPGKSPHLAKRQYFSESDLIISVSNHSREMLHTIWPDITTEVRVIPLGVDEAWFAELPSSVGRLPESVAKHFSRPRSPYMLFLGSRAFHKDFGVALSTLGNLRQHDINLLVIGGGPWTAVETAAIQAANLVGRVHQSNLDDGDLRQVLGNAVCLLMTSRAEGFGLPLIESFAVGTPVVAARIPTQEEFAGGLSLLFEPGDSSGASDHILHLLEESNESRYEQGSFRIQHARKFTWDRTAELTAEAYKSIR